MVAAVRRSMARWSSARSRDIGWLAGGSEIRFATLLLGVIEMSWAWVGIVSPEPRSLFAVRLFEVGLAPAWFGVMFCTGVLTAVGAIAPWRRGRHIGLALSSLVWWTLTGTFLDLFNRSPVAVTMPVFALFAIMLLLADAQRKPREKPPNR